MQVEDECEETGMSKAMASCNCMHSGVPLFDGEDFEQWKKKMEVFLSYQEVIEVVENGIPYKPDDQGFREAYKKDRKALYFIHQGVNKHIFKKIQYAENAYNAWNSLQIIYKKREQVPLPIPHDPPTLDEDTAASDEKTKSHLQMLELATRDGNRRTVLYVYNNIKLEQLDNVTLNKVFFATIAAELYDVALDMLRNHKQLAYARDESQNTALHLLARKPSAMTSESHVGPFKSLIASCCKSIIHNARMRASAHRLVEEIWREVTKNFQCYEILNFISAPSRLLFDAAANGNPEFLHFLLVSRPELILELDYDNHSLFHVAAINRQDNVFTKIYELGAFRGRIAELSEPSTGGTILHLVARLPCYERLQVISGPALQMQSELNWFEAVKRIIPISYIDKQDDNGETASEIFAKQHEKLQKAGEKWMKETSQSCMIVATLVATVVFAAAFTVPGGNNQDTGIPILKADKWFTVFATTDAIALSTSSGSIVLFLSILTSRYTQSDFRRSLPLKLMFGLLTLVISILAMGMAFSASFFLIYKPKVYWILIPVSLGGIPIALYLLLHRRLLVDTISSTIRPINFRLRLGQDAFL